MAYRYKWANSQNTAVQRIPHCTQVGKFLSVVLRCTVLQHNRLFNILWRNWAHITLWQNGNDTSKKQLFPTMITLTSTKNTGSIFRRKYGHGAQVRWLHKKPVDTRFIKPGNLFGNHLCNSGCKYIWMHTRPLLFVNLIQFISVHNLVEFTFDSFSIQVYCKSW